MIFVFFHMEFYDLAIFRFDGVYFLTLKCSMFLDNALCTSRISKMLEQAQEHSSVMPAAAHSNDLYVTSK